MSTPLPIARHAERRRSCAPVLALLLAFWALASLAVGVIIGLWIEVGA